MNKLNLQLFAPETNTTMAADVEPAVSIDYVNRITTNINALKELLGVTSMKAMPVGTSVKIYKTTLENYDDSAAEGELIPLSKAKRELVNTIDLDIKKVRKNTSMEAMQKVGKEIALNETDAAIVKEAQKRIKAQFFTNMNFAGVSISESKGTLQAALAECWAQSKIKFEDDDVDMISFVNPQDIATQLGNTQLSLQSKFGFSYVEDFLGLGTVIVSPHITKGKVYSTPKENINGVYVPQNSDIARQFGLTYDATGLVGMTHGNVLENATIDTLLTYGVEFFPELADGIVGCNIIGA